MVKQSLVQYWMAKWMRKENSDPQLHLMPFTEPIWVVTHPATWEPHKGSRNAPSPVDVPIGFVTNLASVPKSFWKWMPPSEKFAHIAVIHDYLYWNQETSRREADRMFMLAISTHDVAWWKRVAFYLALKLVGDVVWKRNKEDKEDGLVRSLRVLPQRPPVSWVVWKQGNVF